MRCRYQVVTDEMWEARASRFPEHTPSTREYYLLRSIFEEQFPSRWAMETVPKVSHPLLFSGVVLLLQAHLLRSIIQAQVQASLIPSKPAWGCAMASWHCVLPLCVLPLSALSNWL